MKFKVPSGATPLDPNEMNGLIPDYITTIGDLNELEGKNIESAILWLQKSRKKDILNISFVFELHKQMFNQVWKWAGKQRTSEKSIGVLKEHILTKLDQLLKNTDYWIKNKTYPWDEIGVRFHHGLVAIHSFANGNGRHARLMTNVMLQQHEYPLFTWGSKRSSTPIEVEGLIRDEYIAALKAADSENFVQLLKFVKS